MDDDWDLHAVVRSCSATTTNDTFPGPDFQNLPSDFVDDRNDTVSFHNMYQEFSDPPPPAVVMPVPVFQEMAQMKPPLDMNMQIQENVAYPQRFPAATIPQPVRPRRRKNQQMKMVHQMTQEELSADSWAWRKYGQKPIKGSPYPRNYYRCSTSKGCAARKQVERSPNDPGIFVVSYTGEHTHPRPTHRSSLAGSIRSKSNASPAKNNTALLYSASSSSPSASSFSPATPSMEGEAAAQNDTVEMAEEEDVDNENATDLMQNDDDDDVFRGFQDSDQSSGGGDFFPLSSPPWSPAGNTATFGGG